MGVSGAFRVHLGFRVWGLGLWGDGLGCWGRGEASK